ncbi:MAG: redoxin domain-containing protein [Candidatus Firestonebacteria bacterium]|nr:redoxin domain-containing protein [Candidatus Firestonebacteria bacterium]
MREKARKKQLISIIAIFSLIIINSFPIYAFKNVKKGDKALTFTANNLEAGSFSMDTLLGKKATILFFWKLDLSRVATEGESAGKDYDAATKWIQEMAALQKIYDKYKSDGLEIVGITAPVKSIYDKQNNIVRNPDFTPEEIDSIKKYLKENGINFTVILDQGLNIYNSYGIVPFPSTAIIDKEGIIIFELSSYPTFGGENTIEQNVKIATGLEQKSAAPAKAGAVKYIPKGNAGKAYQSAVQFREKDKTDKALEELKEAVKEDPGYVAPHKMLAAIYQEKKDMENAMLEYASILALEPDNPMNHISYGDFSLENGMIDDALKEYELAILSDTTGMEYIGRGGEAKVRKRKIASGDAYYGLGMIAKKQNKKDEAQEHFKKALAYFEGNTSEGDMYSQFSKKKEIHPNQPKARYELGLIYLEKGEEDKAIEEFKQGISAYQIIIKKLLKESWY